MSEITLYDDSGNPTAYIADDGDGTIYLWNGEPVAYLYNKHVYGFNGKHLGWYENGLIRDSKGAKIGFTKENCPRVTKVQPVKKVKKIKKVKSVKRMASVRPVNKTSTSSLPLEVFLMGGSK